MGKKKLKKKSCLHFSFCFYYQNVCYEATCHQEATKTAGEEEEASSDRRQQQQARASLTISKTSY